MYGQKLFYPFTGHKLGATRGQTNLLNPLGLHLSVCVDNWDQRSTEWSVVVTLKSAGELVS